MIYYVRFKCVIEIRKQLVADYVCLAYGVVHLNINNATAVCSGHWFPKHNIKASSYGVAGAWMCRVILNILQTCHAYIYNDK